MSLIKEFAEMEYKTVFYDPLLKHVRSLIPIDYSLFAFNIQKPKFSWDDKLEAYAIVMPPFYIMTGYNGKHVKQYKHEEISTKYKEYELTIHFMEISQFVDYLIDCHMYLFPVFSTRSNAWFIEKKIAAKFFAMMKACLALPNVYYAVYQLRKQLREAVTVKEIAHIIYETGMIRKYLRTGEIATGMFYATDMLNKNVIDDYIFLRKEEVDDAIIEYLDDVLIKMENRRVHKRIPSKLDMGHILGYIQQIKMMYTVK